MDISRETAQREEAASSSVVHRVMMFPLTRVLIGGVIFFGLQMALFYGAASLLGGARDTSLVEFLMAHLGLTASIQAFSAIAAFVFVAKVIERRSLASGGLGRRDLESGITKGFAIGTAMICAVIGSLALAGWYDITGVGLQSPGAWSAVLGFLGTMLAVSVFEEVFYRGVLFRVIEEGLGSWAALAITAALFGILHLGNPNATLLGGLGVALAGVLFAAVYMLTRSLWVAIGLHWAWNFVQGAVFGMPVSGTTFEASLLRATTDGPKLWSGGAFGPEAGLVAYITVAVVSIVMLALAVRRDRVITPRWMRRRIAGKMVRV